MEVLKYGNLLNGETVSQIIMKNSKGTEVRIITYGAAVTHLFVNDKRKKIVDVVLGYDHLEDYVHGSGALGAVVGRHANRIKNASFIADGTEYKITANEGKNSLHSGPSGLIRTNFEHQIIDEHTIKLHALSPDGQEGFPGNLNLDVTYTLDDDNRLIINYKASTDKSTVVNITNHSYFNLNGHESGSAMYHRLMIQSDAITENDKESIPTGNYIPVAGTPFDFTSERVIGERIEDRHEQIVYGSGYDHNFVLKKQSQTPGLAAKLTGEKTGITMNTYTTQPGVQFYTANHLNEKMLGKNNTHYHKRDGVCLETQHFPGAPSNPHFPSVILKPGEEYNQTTIYEFME